MAGRWIAVRRVVAYAALYIAFAGCASAPAGQAAVSRSVSAPETEVRDRIREALKDAPDFRETDAHTFKTGWIQGNSPRAEMGFVMRRPLKQQRLYIVQTSASPEGGTTVRVRCNVMEKGNSGADALAWHPIASDGHYENELLERIDKKADAPPAPEKKP